MSYSVGRAGSVGPELKIFTDLVPEDEMMDIKEGARRRNIHGLHGPPVVFNTEESRWLRWSFLAA